jgi:hypothetical protein
MRRLSRSGRHPQMVLVPNTDALNLDYEQLASIMLHRWLLLQVGRESGQQMRKVSEWLRTCSATIPL